MQRRIPRGRFPSLAIAVAVAIATPLCAAAQVRINVVSKGGGPLPSRVVMINAGNPSAPYELPGGTVTINGVSCSSQISFRVTRHPPFYVPPTSPSNCTSPTTTIELSPVSQFSVLAALTERPSYGESPPWRTSTVIDSENAYFAAVDSGDLNEIAFQAHRYSESLMAADQFELAMRYRAVAIETAAEALALQPGSERAGPWLEGAGDMLVPTINATYLLRDIQSRRDVPNSGAWDRATFLAVRELSTDRQ